MAGGSGSVMAIIEQDLRSPRLQRGVAPGDCGGRRAPALSVVAEGEAVIAVEDGVAASESVVEPIEVVERDVDGVAARAKRIRVARVTRGERVAGERPALRLAAAHPC
jgi:hypothetical protein